MALWPIRSVPNCLPYQPFTNQTGVYNGYLKTPPRHYIENVSYFTQFFYEPSSDLLMAAGWLSTIAWPGWDIAWFTWSAEDGSYLGRGEWGGSIYGLNYAHVTLGSYNKFFGFQLNSGIIAETDYQTLVPVSGGWSINPAAWNPVTSFAQVIVNLQDSLIAGVKDWYLDIWDISGVPIKRGSLRLPNSLGSIAYESRDNCWVITHDGLIGKVNYRLNPPRWEMLSCVQNPTSDALAYFCAFDTKRNRLAVLRVRPDATDGSCQSQLEFYRPLYRAAALTDPVPVSPLLSGQGTRFVAHLYGDAGEGVANHLVYGTVDAPALGQMAIPMAGTGLNGAVTLGYQAGAPGSDTLQLAATVTDGEDQ